MTDTYQATWRQFSGGAVGAYALTPDAWHQLTSAGREAAGVRLGTGEGSGREAAGVRPGTGEGSGREAAGVHPGPSAGAEG
jgi:hypothetical protein